MSEFKTFADENLIVAKMAKFVCNRVENIVGKGVTSIFLLFLQCFKKVSITGLLKVGIVWSTG